MKDNKEHNSYIGGLINGVSSLLTGMKTTMTVFCRKKTTEQYPENRKTLKLSERFRGTLTMPHNEQNEHHCVACGLCQMACPNDTIKVTSETIETSSASMPVRMMPLHSTRILSMQYSTVANWC